MAGKNDCYRVTITFDSGDDNRNEERFKLFLRKLKKKYPELIHLSTLPATPCVEGLRISFGAFDGCEMRDILISNKAQIALDELPNIVEISQLQLVPTSANQTNVFDMFSPITYI